jgi:hypothetical protein
MQKDLISSSFIPVDEADTVQQFVPLPGYYQQLSTCLSSLAIFAFSAAIAINGVRLRATKLATIPLIR